MSKGQKQTDSKMAIYHKKTTKGCLSWVYTVYMGHQMTDLHQKFEKMSYVGRRTS